MTKEELDEYQQSLKNYRDMYLIENEYKRELARMIAEKDSALAEKDSALAVMRKNLVVKDKALATKDKSLQKALAELAELKRRLMNNE